MLDYIQQAYFQTLLAAQGNSFQTNDATGSDPSTGGGSSGDSSGGSGSTDNTPTGDGSTPAPTDGTLTIMTNPIV